MKLLSSVLLSSVIARGHTGNLGDHGMPAMMGSASPRPHMTGSAGSMSGHASGSAHSGSARPNSGRAQASQAGCNGAAMAMWRREMAQWKEHQQRKYL